jgi:hypothetical protein
VRPSLHRKEVLSPGKLGRVAVDGDGRVREPERPIETEAGPEDYPLPGSGRLVGGLWGRSLTRVHEP